MPLQNAIENLVEFGKELGLKNLEYDENNTCILGIDDTFSLHLTYEPNSDRLYLYSPLLDGLPPDDKIRLKLYEDLLEGSMLGGQMAGGGVGVAVKEGLILMHCTLEMRNAKSSNLREFAPLYVETVEKWRKRCADICAGKQPEINPLALQTAKQLKQHMASASAATMPAQNFNYGEYKKLNKQAEQYYRQGKFSDAITIHEEMLKKNKDHTECWLQLARLHWLENPTKLNKENITIAEHCFKKALNSSMSKAARIEYGFYLLINNKFEEAEVQLISAIKLIDQPNTEKLIFEKVDCPRLDSYLQREFDDKNLTMFKTDILALTLYGLVLCNTKSNNLSKQKEYLDQLNRLAEQQATPENYRLLAYVYEQLGNNQKAGEIFAHSLSLIDETPVAKKLDLLGMFASNKIATTTTTQSSLTATAASNPSADDFFEGFDLQPGQQDTDPNLEAALALSKSIN